VHVSFLFTVFLALILRTSGGREIAVVFASALIHEAAHLVCLLACGCRDLTLTLLPGGARIGGAGFGALPYKKATFCVLAGPAVNLALAGALFLCCRFHPAAMTRRAAEINLALGLGNLLPLSFLDGGRALRAALDAKRNAPVSAAAVGALDTAVLVFLCAVTAVLTVLGADTSFLMLFTAYCIASKLMGF
jgi:Zn-dependent protease